MTNKKKRGFAAMDPALQRELASRGGKKAQSLGTAHRFTPAEAAKAGAKGGGKLAKDRDYMRKIGARGGRNSWKGRQ